MSLRRLRLFSALAFSSLLFQLSGCFFLPVGPGECNGPGDLEISWLFDGSPLCPADAETVYVRVWRDGDPLHKNADGDAFPCENRRVLYTSLSCGSYDIAVDAVDASGATTWEVPITTVSVQSQLVNSAPTNLRGAP